MTTIETKAAARAEKMLAENKASEFAGGINHSLDYNELYEEALRVENWLEAKREKENNSFVTMTTVSIEKMTEKAIQIKSKIRDYNKTAWMPKSVCEILENGNVQVKAWFAAKENLTPIW